MGEPGQKGSKGNKGEHVSVTGVPPPSPQTLSPLSSGAVPASLTPSLPHRVLLVPLGPSGRLGSPEQP